MNFENVIVRNIHASRYVASWMHAGGSTKGGKNRALLRTWLEQLTIDGSCLTADEVNKIYWYATNGKMELEHNAERFLNTH